MPFHSKLISISLPSLLILALFSSRSSGFLQPLALTHAHHFFSSQRAGSYKGYCFQSLRAQVGSDEGDSTPSGDSYEGDIDWDAEWKKVVAQKGQKIDRPGKDFYKNDAQKAAAKATRVASEQIQKIRVVQPDINMRMLAGDTKFWIAILAIISIGLALITAPDTSSYSSTNESFYI